MTTSASFRVYPRLTAILGESKAFFKCPDTRTGELLWQYTELHREVPVKIDGDWKFIFGKITPNLGICSTTAVDEGQVHFVDHRGEVLCLDVDGAPKTSAAPNAAEATGTNQPAPPTCQGREWCGGVTCGSRRACGRPIRGWDMVIYAGSRRNKSTCPR